MTSRKTGDSDVIPEEPAPAVGEPGSGIQLPGGKLETLDLPGGTPELLLLHEGLGSVSMWRDFPAELGRATGKRVVAYSRFGFGSSSPRATPYGPGFINEEAETVLPELRAKLGLGKPVLVGHSTGASMALLHAAIAPDLVAGVVAMAPLIDVEPTNLQSIAAARKQWEESDWREKLARHHDDVDAVFRGWNDTWLDPAFRDWSIERELARIRCPVLAILGADDPYSSRRQLQLLRRSAALAHVETFVIPDCGHAPHREQPVRVTQLIADFVAACGKRRFER